ncbi:MAG: hypothetical protein I3273_01675 [Candidatus Moeniiplasma glomeromycotorum]|nr:hypothetical protein [Candidatus Moeniiplasma glomeromycotorum]MCE8167170.1 hypothetical protein [Candidatus Moeniiplasma glomeromycotorum]MCE8168818.1 hypothetical protein [Candidatus Moeniiplasma glomeromycotorum]
MPNEIEELTNKNQELRKRIESLEEENKNAWWNFNREYDVLVRVKKEIKDIRNLFTENKELIDSIIKEDKKDWNINLWSFEETEDILSTIKQLIKFILEEFVINKKAWELLINENIEQKERISNLIQEQRKLLIEKQQLLAEIELLKNPPQQPNKEKLQVETTQYQEQVKALVQKLPTEQIKTINLLLQEQKNKFNQQLQAKETQINLLDKGKQRERERERETNLLGSDFTFNSYCVYFVDQEKEEIRR